MEQTYFSRSFARTSLVVDLAAPELSVSLFQLSLEFVAFDANILILGAELLVLTTEFQVLCHSVLEFANYSWCDGGHDARLNASWSRCQLQRMDE
jgi:hypothetical protein